MIKFAKILIDSKSFYHLLNRVSLTLRNDEECVLRLKKNNGTTMRLTIEGNELTAEGMICEEMRNQEEIITTISSSKLKIMLGIFKLLEQQPVCLLIEDSGWIYIKEAIL